MTFFEQELSQLSATYDSGVAAEIGRIKAAITGASQSSVVAVGSGGSFTVASMLCGLHETYTGRVSRPVTPLELICNPGLASTSPVFLVSAEGKNPDIVEALKRARTHSARQLHILTNHSSSPLVECAREMSEVTTHVFPLDQKDGYLATNSLLLNATVLARTYIELNDDQARVPTSLDQYRVDGMMVQDWLEQARAFVARSGSRPGAIVTFSPLLRPVAMDLESKLSEAALLYCQLADLRTFAHGRHLWLAKRPADCCLIAFVEPSLAPLWSRTQELLPADVPSLTIPLSGHGPLDLVVGLLATMHLVSALANARSQDVAKPVVPGFGREIYYMDLGTTIPIPQGRLDSCESKSDVIGARWPSMVKAPALRRHGVDFVDAITAQEFNAIVFDYDGTLCSSSRRELPPPQPLLELIQLLVQEGVTVAVATGRGGSVDEQLRGSLPESLWNRVPLAMYNGGWITTVGGLLPGAGPNSEFLSHVTRIARRLQKVGVPIDEVRTTHPYQVSIRFREGIPTDGMWFVMADALRQAGLDVSRLERSKHSLDVLAPGVNKSRLIAHLVQTHKVDPYHVLTIGDQGAWPGNDSSLLEHKFSLSVDEPSRRLDRGWKLAPAHKRDVDATLWYLQRMIVSGKGVFKLVLDDAARAAL